ncbi:hypothetical protein BDK61_2554 [Haloarcula quadrata]|uniref:Uncharacterized protein n=1 Tax=Haloarcula quadrata TaxID=182779 RepID=A0A495R8M3_9EURY|nr:hypothetical protein BDK61_2554 [Haloarcula quadrata]
MVRKVRIVSEPRVEEISVRRHTYRFFEFGDDHTEEMLLMSWPWSSSSCSSLWRSRRTGGLVVGVGDVLASCRFFHTQLKIYILSGN